MQALLLKLTADFPALTFRRGPESCWSPLDRAIIYKQEGAGSELETWSLLHEVGHATLEHTSYSSDFELLKLEAAAWQQALQLAVKYGHTIDDNHVQDCLDTYRDWLHCRSTCPVCTSKSLQEHARIYNCFNCGCRWQVSTSLFCRPYRRRQPSQIKVPVVRLVKQATFI